MDWSQLKNLFSQIQSQLSSNLSDYLISGAIIIGAAIGAKLLGSIFARLTRKYFNPDSEDGAADPRNLTLLPLVLSIERYLLYFITAVIVLGELGINVSAIIASAGVVGLAVGFGAQNLVRDLIAGFFLIFDGLVHVGDVVTLDDKNGVIENIDLRNTQLREFNGRLWTIPNGEMRSFGNFNRGWTRAVVDVGLGYEQDPELGLKIMEQISAEWVEQFPELVIEPPQVQGLMDLGAYSVGARLVIKTPAMKHWEVERELRRRIKDRFDAEGIDIPFPRQVIYSRSEK